MRNFSEKIMSFDSGNALERFIERFFEANGAAVEKHPGRLDALLPEHLAVRLKLPEYLQLKTGADVEEKLAVHYGSPLLEKIVDAACDTVPLVDCRLDFDYIKRQRFEKLIQEQFIFYNSVGQVKSAAEVKTEYLVLTCRYLAQSDEQKEGLVTLVFNLETGASLSGMEKMFDRVRKTFEKNSGSTFLDTEKVKKVLIWVQRQAGPILGRELEPFQNSMNRRFQRDVANLEEYYEALKQEMQESLRRPGISDQLIADRKAKIDLIPDELERKKADLFKKYSIKVKLGLCGTMRIRTHAALILYQTRLGRKQKQLSMIYNPVTKSMEPLVCEGCGESIFSIRFCDRLHVLCPECSRKCPAC
jgi:hypothetical protein